jgi:hypothetical protein
MKKLKVALAATVVIVLSLAVLTRAADKKGGAAAGTQKTYPATVWVAGHGGHFAQAEVTIDPGDAENPVKVKSLEQLNVGTPESHKLHDARLDPDGQTMFWSTYALDKDGKLHVGKSSVKTGKVIQDVAFVPDERAPAKNPPAYCASGQSKTAFLPVFMGSEAYVDVWDKKTMARRHRLYVSDLGYKTGSYMFVHGTNSNNMKRFLVTVTLKGEDGKMNGKQDLLMLDLPALENGKLKVLTKATLVGEPGKTIAFRQYFTTDDKLIYQSAADRMWVIDAATLKLVDEKMTKGFGENHDVMPTPDGKFALLTLRTSDTASCDEKGNPVPDKKITDGALLLYDATAHALVGKPTSVCFACHKDAGKGDKNAVLCGIAARFGK